MSLFQQHESISLNEMNYIVISPVRNEAQYIEQTIQSMLNQTIKPAKWIIVNDSSTDETAEIIARYTGAHSWLELANKSHRDNQVDRQRGKGVIDTFYFGYERLIGQDYEYIIKLDGDISFEANYFEFLLEKFRANPKLGIAGGFIYERFDGKNWSVRSAKHHVGGPAKMYRRACFEAIGGLIPMLGWDGIDEWKALSLGWQVESFPKVRVWHHRTTGSATGLVKAKIEQGYGAHYMGYHPLYLIARGLRHMFTRRPYLIGGALLIAAYFFARLQGREQLPDPAVTGYVRQTQKEQLTALLLGR